MTPLTCARGRSGTLGARSQHHTPKAWKTPTSDVGSPYNIDFEGPKLRNLRPPGGNTARARVGSRLCKVSSSDSAIHRFLTLRDTTTRLFEPNPRRPVASVAKSARLATSVRLVPRSRWSTPDSTFALRLARRSPERACKEGTQDVPACLHLLFKKRNNTRGSPPNASDVPLLPSTRSMPDSWRVETPFPTGTDAPATASRGKTLASHMCMRASGVDRLTLGTSALWHTCFGLIGAMLCMIRVSSRAVAGKSYKAGARRACVQMCHAAVCIRHAVGRPHVQRCACLFRPWMFKPVHVLKRNVYLVA